MAKVVKARHNITGIVVEIPVEQFTAMAFTPLHSVYEVLPDDHDADCVSCGEDDQPEDLEVGDVEDELDYVYEIDEEEE